MKCLVLPQSGLKLCEFGKLLKKCFGFLFARAIASLVCSFVSFLCCSCSRLGDNRADEGEICRVENGPISQLSSLFYCVVFGLL